jgi:hypothetical protein
MQAAMHPDPAVRLREFDANLFGHIGFAISNAVRSVWMGLTFAAFGKAPGDDYTRRFYRKLNRYSANLALVADTSMLTLGGKLKFKESLSGRLGDVLSQLYIASAMLKRYEDEGRRPRSVRCWPGPSTTACTRSSWRSRGPCATTRSARWAGCSGCWCSRSAAAPSRPATASVIAPPRS